MKSVPFFPLSINTMDLLTLWNPYNVFLNERNQTTSKHKPPPISGSQKNSCDVIISLFSHIKKE